MVKIRVANHYYNGENNSKQLIVTHSYGSTPIKLEFLFPDGNTFVVRDLVSDKSGYIEYPLSSEILYQNGDVSAQATVTTPSGAIEKSSVVSFPVGGSINATENLTLSLRNKRLYPKGGNSVVVVGDNKDYRIKFIGIENFSAIFAIFNRDGKTNPPIMLSETGEVDIPLWVLKGGTFEVGLYSEGFASTPITVSVDRSIVDKSGVIEEDPDQTIVEQLIKKVNDIKYIKACNIVNGKLIIYLNDGSEIDAGIVDDDDSTTIIQADQEQNDATQPNYIMNRTHYKETDNEGNIIYHRLDNNYLNLDNAVKKDSANPVTSEAVFEAINNDEPDTISNIEIEEILKNFV